MFRLVLLPRVDEVEDEHLLDAGVCQVEAGAVDLGGPPLIFK